MKYTPFAIVKILLLIIALGVASFLAFSEKAEELTPDHKIVFVLDINRTMNTQDVLSGTKEISRISAAKSLIKQTILSEPGFSYGLILFNATADYIIPSTFDTGTFLLYLSGITTNILPDGNKSFASLSGVMKNTSYTSYVVLSDFDTSSAQYTFPAGTSLIGLGSLEGDYVKYSNGVRYYENGKSVSSARNDSLARSFGLSYTPLTTIDFFSSHTIVFTSFSLPLGQRIVLYTLLGILVILVVML